MFRKRVVRAMLPGIAIVTLMSCVCTVSPLARGLSTIPIGSNHAVFLLAISNWGFGSNAGCPANVDCLPYRRFGLLGYY